MFPDLLRRLLFPAFLLLVASAPAGADPAPVRVLLWFDEEDLLLKADDDAVKRLADLLTARDIRATFKIVGEKARMLERRGRMDVIAAIKRHEIGYHSDFHSVHPTPTEYLAECGWDDGIDEFVRREGDGAADVRRIFGVDTLVCYGQPGASWAPQGAAALARLGVVVDGIPIYIDEDVHVGMDGLPFWYAGALHVFRMRPNLTRLDLHNPQGLDPAKQRFDEIVGRLQAGEGGLVSIFYHPNEWVQRRFWDAVNFARGANPPRAQWVEPPQRTPEEVEAAFARFEAYVDHINATPGVTWITARDLPGLYPDLARSRGASINVLDELAARILVPGASLDYQKLGDTVYSVADQFELLVRTLEAVSAGGAPQFPLRATGLLGPDATAPREPAGGEVDAEAFADALRDTGDFIRSRGRVPARVFFGSSPVAPADYLVAMAAAWAAFRESGILPAAVPLVHGTTLACERHVVKDTPRTFGSWIIHKENFQAPKLMELARLQAWTIKPALPASGLAR